MLLRPFLNDGGSCASQLFGRTSRGTLAVVDAHADLVDDYLAAAAAIGSPIVAVFETHVQADHVSGLPALVERTGATAYLPRGPNVEFDHARRRRAGRARQHGRDRDRHARTCAGTPGLLGFERAHRALSRFAAEGEPGTDALAGMSKVVFSSTLSEPLSWANTQLVAGDAVEAVREMKANSSSSMRTIGSLTLCRSFLNAGLVDRFRVVVFPVITGSSGRERIYDGYPDVALEMINSRTFDGRIQLLEYVPTILSGPPATNTASA